MRTLQSTLAVMLLSLVFSLLEFVLQQARRRRGTEPGEQAYAIH